MFKVKINGRVVGYERKTWDSFKSDSGETIEAGQSYALYIWEEGPDHDGMGTFHKVKVRAVDFPTVREYGFGIEVEADCEARANRNTLNLTLVGLRAGVKA